MMFETLQRRRVLLIGLTRARRGRGLNNISSRIGPKASELMIGTIPDQITIFIEITEHAIDAALRAGIKSGTFARLGEWRACEAVEWPFGPLVKLLLLTAQRREEVAGIERAELDLEKGIWAMPREKAKNNRAHTVQLSTAALNVLNSIPKIGGRFVFTVTGTAPVSGFSRAKRRLDAAMLATKRDEFGADCEPIPHWTLHDLRRTATTGMAQLNIPPHVVDKVLNHISGTIRGVAAVYNRFEYLDERRQRAGDSALVDALARRQVRGAALDVMVEEPLPAASPRWSIHHAHTAGETCRYQDNVLAILHENVARRDPGAD